MAMPEVVPNGATSQPAAGTASSIPPGGAPTADSGAAPPAQVTHEPKPTSTDWARIRSAERRLKSERDAFGTERAALSARLDALEKSSAAAQARVVELERDQELAKQDPIGWAEKHGVNPNTAVKGYLANGTPEKAIQQANDRAAATEKRVADFLAAQEKKDKEREQGALRSAEESQIRAVISAIDQNKKEWPFATWLQRASPNEIPGKLWDLQKICRESGTGYSLSQIKTAIEKYAQKRYRQIQSELPEESAASTNGQATTASLPGNRAGNEKTATQGAGPKPRTPVVPAKLSSKEAMAADLANLRGAIARDAAARDAAKNGASNSSRRPSTRRA